MSDPLVEEIHEWAREHPVVFVCGFARSGTTRVYAVFQCSPEFMRETGYINESGLLRNFDRIEEYRSVEEMFRFLGEPGPEPNEFDRALDIARDWPSEERRAFLIRAFLFVAHRFGQMPRLAEKTPGHERGALELAACFPRARFLYVQRHPVDVLSSVRGVYRRETAEGRRENADRAWHIDAGPFAEMYRNSVNAFQDMQRQMSDRVLHVAYEVFVSDPEATMRRAFAFVGAAFDPDYLDSRGKSDHWGDWEPFLTSPIRPLPSTWRERLRPEEIEKVQSKLADVLAGSGYEAYRV